MIQTGEAEQDESGAVHVSKSKAGMANIIGNRDDF